MGRAGTYIKQPGGFDAFMPEPLPPFDLRPSPKLQTLDSAASLALGRLDGMVELIPDPDRFVLMFVRREAVLSSQIEGTVASLMDVLEHEALVEQADTRMDVKEIQNHVAAMNHGIERLASLPLGRRLLCEVHAILMKDVRGGEPGKTPGEFRTSQNWIGGGSPATANFVPPPPREVATSFARLEEFLHSDDPLPPLIKVGLAHAQFETIHPFLDGNGRTGRLLITFWLVEQGILRKPLLYPSLFLKENRSEYNDRLQAIRDEGAWERWLEFFIDGIAQTAKEATTTAAKILQLRESDRERISLGLGRRAANALRLHEFLFRYPVITASTVQWILDVSQPTASGLVNSLEEIGLLREITGRARYRVYRYGDYVQLFPGASNRR